MMVSIWYLAIPSAAALIAMGLCWRELALLRRLQHKTWLTVYSARKLAQALNAWEIAKDGADEAAARLHAEQCLEKLWAIMKLQFKEEADVQSKAAPGPEKPAEA